LEDVGDNNGFSLITDYDGNDEQAFEVNVKSGEILPVLPLRNMVLFPGVFLPITVGRKGYERMMNEIMPVQQAEVYRKPTKKVVEEAVKELNPDTNSLGSRG
jgi:ATP-dependent Lon protease